MKLNKYQNKTILKLGNISNRFLMRQRDRRQRLGRKQGQLRDLQRRGVSKIVEDSRRRRLPRIITGLKSPISLGKIVLGI